MTSIHNMLYQIKASKILKFGGNEGTIEKINKRDNLLNNIQLFSICYFFK